MPKSVANSPYFLSTLDLKRGGGNIHNYVLEVEPLENIGDVMEYAPKGTPVGLNVNLSSVVEGIYLHGDLSAKVNRMCAKCGKMQTNDVILELKAFYFYDDKLASDGADFDSKGAEEVYALVDSQYIDLIQLVRDTLYDSFSFAPICSGECIKVEDSSKDEEEIDPRFAILKNLATNT